MAFYVSKWHRYNSGSVAGDRNFPNSLLIIGDPKLSTHQKGTHKIFAFVSGTVRFILCGQHY